LVAAFVQPAYIRYQGLGVPHLDFEGSDECVLGLYNEMAGVAEVLEANCELHLCFPLPLPLLRFWCGARRHVHLAHLDHAVGVPFLWCCYR
jgi:hypothetical protein